MSRHHSYAKFCKKKSQNSRNHGFSYYFCLMLEGSRSGSIPLTNGSGSRRPKNMWIPWIRIRNTAVKTTPPIMYKFFDIVIMNLCLSTNIRNGLRIIFWSLTNLRVITKPRNYGIITRFRNYVTTLPLSPSGQGGGILRKALLQCKDVRWMCSPLMVLGPHPSTHTRKHNTSSTVFDRLFVV